VLKSNISPDGWRISSKYRLTVSIWSLHDSRTAERPVANLAGGHQLQMASMWSNAAPPIPTGEAARQASHPAPSASGATFDDAIEI
jgi:hypothetical protein